MEGTHDIMATIDNRLLLLIDDEPAQGRLISALAAREGFRAIVAGTAEEGLARLAGEEGEKVAIVLLDQWVPGDGACDLIRELKETRPDVPVLMLTASTSPLLAIEAMRAGATDYLIKPVAPERLQQALRSAARREKPLAELQPLAEKLASALDFDAMVGSAPKFRFALARAATAARGHGHVLVDGETGTGKDMLLRAMHAGSPRAKAPVRTVNVGSMPASSLESLIFGHERGSFAGAFDRQTGLMETCDGGTLVIDEIDRLDPAIQARLADALKRGIVRPTGSAHGFRVDVRILAASDRPLVPLVASGEFDADLHKALTATYVVLPPLRERAGDIPALTRYFLNKIGSQPGMQQHSIADSALALLEAYDWPGNVRQLQAVLFRAAVFCEGESLTADCFPQLSEMLGNQDNREAKHQRGLGVMLYTDDGNLRALEDIEADIIRLAIGHYRGRMTEVARRLGIGRSTLYRKLGELGIDSAA